MYIQHIDEGNLSPCPFSQLGFNQVVIYSLQGSALEADPQDIVASSLHEYELDDEMDSKLWQSAKELLPDSKPKEFPPEPITKFVTPITTSWPGIQMKSRSVISPSAPPLYPDLPDTDVEEE